MRRGRPYASLRSSSEIREVRRKGSRRRVGELMVFSTEAGRGPPRAAVVAGRNVGAAVRRNRAKRRLREALARVPLREGRDYVVIATSEAVAEVPFEALVNWVRRAVDEEE